MIKTKDLMGGRMKQCVPELATLMRTDENPAQAKLGRGTLEIVGMR